MFWDEMKGKICCGWRVIYWFTSLSRWFAVIFYDSGIASVEKQQIPSLLQNVLAENEHRGATEEECLLVLRGMSFFQGLFKILKKEKKKKKKWAVPCIPVQVGLLRVKSTNFSSLDGAALDFSLRLNLSLQSFAVQKIEHHQTASKFIK